MIENVSMSVQDEMTAEEYSWFLAYGDDNMVYDEISARVQEELDSLAEVSNLE